MKVIETIKLVINQETVDKYHEHYFKKYPRRSKKPIDKPIPPTLNKWASSMIRQQSNVIKQQWKEFIEWIVEIEGLSNKGISRCKMTYNYYFPTRRKIDLDNMTPKFVGDGLVTSGFLVDDNYFVINPLTITGNYDKDNPRTEIITEVLANE